jgi:hypothetical protein
MDGGLMGEPRGDTALNQVMQVNCLGHWLQILYAMKIYAAFQKTTDSEIAYFVFVKTSQKKINVSNTTSID